MIYLVLNLNTQRIPKSSGDLKIIMIGLKKLGRVCSMALRARFAFGQDKDPFKGIQQSSFYRPLAQVEQFFKQLKIEYKPSPNDFKIKECPYCEKP
jgi:hypothetical protein